MLGLEGQRPGSPDGKTLLPLQAHGIAAMSIGFLVDAEQPMVWRGPMVTQALTQLLSETRWGELDYLVVDMPPGTGDIQLTLAQRVPVSGAVIVTTPQDIALADARKGLKMFEKVSVPVLGIVENMSLHVCSNCGHVEHIFGAGGGQRMAEQYSVNLLGELPLDAKIREEADGGKPSVVAAPDSPRSRPISTPPAARPARSHGAPAIAAACSRRSWWKRAEPTRSARDFVVAAVQELDQAEPMAEWVCEHCDVAPRVRSHRTFRRCARSPRSLAGFVDVRHDEVEVHGSPVP